MPKYNYHNMKKYMLDQGDLYLGDHDIKDHLKKVRNIPQVSEKKSAQEFLDHKLEELGFGVNSKSRELVDLFGKIHNLDRYALLAAHGDEYGQWTYFDEGKEHTVQSWINKVDGKYSGILLCVCNPENYTPSSKKSVLLVPDNDIDLRNSNQNCIFSLILPEIGEVSSYTIDYEINNLKKQLGITFPNSSK